jgi:hypothetical protein
MKWTVLKNEIAYNDYHILIASVSIFAPFLNQWAIVVLP